MITDIEQFKEYTLFPTLFEKIDTAFPELQFKKVGTQWQSKRHLLNPEENEGHVITYVYSNSKFCAKDQATGDSEELINLYVKYHSGDRNSAIVALCDILGLTSPLGNTENWKDYENQQKNREYANKVFRNSLQEDTPEAKQVRDYFLGRGWTLDEVKNSGIGLITTSIRDSLSDGNNYKGIVKVPVSDIVERKNGVTIVKSKNTRDREKAEGKAVDRTEENIIGGVGTTHLLTIPFRSGSILRGFKFRHLGQIKDDEGKDVYKYYNTKGIEKGASLFNIGIGVKDLVIVEGDLDALHAQVKGIDNVAATAGNGATQEQINDAVKRGVEKFTLLFDNDSAGQKFTIDTIKLIQAKDKSIYIAQFPDGIKDLDEYLCTHTKEDFVKLIAEAQSYCKYLYYKITEKFCQKEQEKGYVTDKERDEFFAEVKRLQNSPYTKPYDRQLILDLIEAGEGGLHFNASDFAQWEEREYQQRQSAQRIAKMECSVQQISEALKVGDIETAKNIIQRTYQNINDEANKEKYAKYLHIPTDEEFWKEYEMGADDVETPYYFQTMGDNKEIEQFTLPSAAITFICAQTSHGKSTFLQNLALYAAKDSNDGSVLYFTYEERKQDVRIQFENKYINKSLSLNNRKSISTYRRKKQNYFRGDGLNEYLKGSQEYVDTLINTGKLRVYEEHSNSTDLLNIIKYLCDTIKVKAVFIDYMQKIPGDSTRNAKSYEILKGICNDFNEASISLQIPIVVAAQLNREAKSPVDMYAQNMAEAADLERVANKVVLLWNSTFKAQGKENPELKDWEKRTGITLGNGGSIYALLSKNRGGIANIEAVFTYRGNEGVITQQMPTPQQIEAAKKAEETWEEQQSKGHKFDADSNVKNVNYLPF